MILKTKGKGIKRKESLTKNSTASFTVIGFHVCKSIFFKVEFNVVCTTSSTFNTLGFRKIVDWELIRFLVAYYTIIHVTHFI